MLLCIACRVAQELLPGWSSLTSTYLMALASNTVQQNLVTEPISRLLEALCYGE